MAIDVNKLVADARKAQGEARTAAQKAQAVADLSTKFIIVRA